MTLNFLNLALWWTLSRQIVPFFGCDLCSLPPPFKLQIVQDMDSHSAEYTAPGIIIPCASVSP